MGMQKANLVLQAFEGYYVMTDDKGRVLAKFAASVGITDSTEAEVLAVVFVLELSLKKEWLKNGSIIMESHSKVAATWINSTCPWHLRLFGNKWETSSGS